MKTMILAAAAAAAALLTITAGTAHADPATHSRFSFSNTVTFPAGTICDFNLQESGTLNFIETDVSNGQMTILATDYATHTNLDTGYSLSEVDHFTQTFQLGSGTFINAGIFWHLRDPSGKVVLVKAGEITVDTSTFEIIRFTPNGDFDKSFRDIICPPLGGSPA